VVTNLTKTSVRRDRAIPSRRAVRRSTARHPAHRRLLDLHGIELYAVLSYRVALAVIAVIAVTHLGH
jgi:hypothetical protein